VKGLANNPMRVNIVPRSGDHEPVSDDEGDVMAFVLEGAGGGCMRIADIPANLVETGRIKIGDLVMSDPRNPWLSSAMMIGKIDQLELVRDAEKPLYYDATVRQPFDPGMLSQVFIVDLSRAGGWER